ncbi:uncharacterized protein SPSK_04598 [Sporothrix schenckii 1099-18]|uniref:Uncharacterized protein n=1 Tax=Sporothrix schenckii 1099-18 TaxID=1397361 RepID=A0A0F2M0V5_SPOSC|nr:uncharacterized protein SPSK_04598 [Sporothrix schenckii 1099-18]KJR83343.1 hypothetical protein SPSK_04598 [Sporothrix schenckii 1099-18]
MHFFQKWRALITKHGQLTDDCKAGQVNINRSRSLVTIGIFQGAFVERREILHVPSPPGPHHLAAPSPPHGGGVDDDDLGAVGAPVAPAAATPAPLAQDVAGAIIVPSDLASLPCYRCFRAAFSGSGPLAAPACSIPMLRALFPSLHPIPSPTDPGHKMRSLAYSTRHQECDSAGNITVSR